MQLETVLYEKKGNIAWVRLNRPNALNAENDQLAREVPLALEQARRDPEVRVVIMKGEGRAFCAGADVKESSVPKSTQDSIDHYKHIQDTVRLVRELGKPIIAAVHGYALGAGCEYAMMCDIRIAAEGAKFGFPEASVGAPVTTAGTQMLERLVGLGKAKELVFTCQFIEAKEAERIGLVNKVVPLAELDEAALEMANKIAKNYPLAIRLMRYNLDLSTEVSQDAILHMESTIGEITRLAGIFTEGFSGKKETIGKKSE